MSKQSEPETEPTFDFITDSRGRGSAFVVLATKSDMETSFPVGLFDREEKARIWADCWESFWDDAETEVCGQTINHANQTSGPVYDRYKAKLRETEKFDW